MAHGKPTPELTAETEAERRLIDAARTGERAPTVDLDKSQRVVRPAFLRALLMGRIEGVRVSDRGLLAADLIFQEHLDMSRLGRAGQPMPPLYIRGAELGAGADFRASHWQSLDFRGVKVGSYLHPADLNCDWIEIVHGLSADGITVTGEFRLGAESIGADADLSGATLNTLVMSGARIGGSLYCNANLSYSPGRA